MPHPKERLSYLLELASQGDTARATLAHEISGILLDWPAQYSDSAKLPFEALLEKTLREIDDETRMAVAARFAQSADAPVDIVNELFFASSAAMRGDIIARNLGVDRVEESQPDFDERALLDAARFKREDCSTILGRSLRIAKATADAILNDVTGQSLVIASKGAHVSRATFSTLAILCNTARGNEDTHLRLEGYDDIPSSAAEQILASWRANVAAIPYAE